MNKQLEDVIIAEIPHMGETADAGEKSKSSSKDIG